jgi:U6 snRNA-associated Sm-like protein LSm1
MENLSLDDRPPTGPPQQMPGVLPGLPPPTAPQLPPQMFTTAAQLLNLTDSEYTLGNRTRGYNEGAADS